MKLFRRNGIVGIQQFMSEDPKTKVRTPHIYIFTRKRVVEIDYSGKQKRVVATLKQIKEAK